MSDPDFTPNFGDDPSLSDAEANEADVIEQSRDDLSQTPEDVDERVTPHGYGDDAETELDDANDYESASDYDEGIPASDYDE
ncbi:hypothetical protein [Paramicrobacterium agarici]|uniref:Uncharacterized protein n=1 Tax=Paramicrobacterium agarici TaxID=630514 RepID=A0A2A9DUA7_9MICO|nr:hypothetical protein [Microbacterium agarici]PFG29479.1 hypothetical protein ATJ78_0385 [Microbacterium agarici]TQO22484.1 hypothetical protein FB385_1315 [Microbacterium agarici]